MAKKKRGRPRKAGLRTKSGRLSRAHNGAARDYGTHEAEEKRLALVNGSDPALFSLPVDVALARGCISREQHNAATWLRIVRSRIFGRSGPRTLLWDLVDRGASSLPEDQLAKAERAYAWAMGQLTEDEQVEVAELVLDRFPRWLRLIVQGVPLGSEETRAQELLVSGLDKLRR